MTYHNQPVGDVIRELGTDADCGLSQAQIAELRTKYGANKLAEKRKSRSSYAFWNSSRT